MATKLTVDLIERIRNGLMAGCTIWQINMIVPEATRAELKVIQDSRLLTSAEDTLLILTAATDDSVKINIAKTL